MATDEEIIAWFGLGVQIDAAHPNAERPFYLVTIPEFGFEGRGATLDEAYENAMKQLSAMVDEFESGIRVLPDRGDWLNRPSRRV